MPDAVGTVDTNGFNTTVNQAINGTGDLTKAGDGVLTLASIANTYDGDTIVEGGTLAIAADGSLGSNANGYVVMYDDTTLQFNGAVTSDRTLDIVGGPTSSATVNTNTTAGTWPGQLQGPSLIHP